MDYPGGGEKKAEVKELPDRSTCARSDIVFLKKHLKQKRHSPKKRRKSRKRRDYSRLTQKIFTQPGVEGEHRYFNQNEVSIFESNENRKVTKIDEKKIRNNRQRQRFRKSMKYAVGGHRSVHNHTLDPLPTDTVNNHYNTDSTSSTQILLPPPSTHCPPPLPSLPQGNHFPPLPPTSEPSLGHYLQSPATRPLLPTPDLHPSSDPLLGRHLPPPPPAGLISGHSPARPLPPVPGNPPADRSPLIPDHPPNPSDTMLDSSLRSMSPMPIPPINATPRDLIPGDPLPYSPHIHTTSAPTPLFPTVSPSPHQSNDSIKPLSSTHDPDVLPHVSCDGDAVPAVMSCINNIETNESIVISDDDTYRGAADGKPIASLTDPIEIESEDEDCLSNMSVQSGLEDNEKTVKPNVLLIDDKRLPSCKQVDSTPGEQCKDGYVRDGGDSNHRMEEKEEGEISDSEEEGHDENRLVGENGELILIVDSAEVDYSQNIMAPSHLDQLALKHRSETTDSNVHNTNHENSVGASSGKQEGGAISKQRDGGSGSHCDIGMDEKEEGEISDDSEQYEEGCHSKNRPEGDNHHDVKDSVHEIGVYHEEGNSSDHSHNQDYSQNSQLSELINELKKDHQVELVRGVSSRDDRILRNDGEEKEGEIKDGEINDNSACDSDHGDGNRYGDGNHGNGNGNHGNGNCGDGNHGDGNRGDDNRGDGDHHGDSACGNCTDGDGAHGDGNRGQGNGSHGDGSHGDGSHGDGSHGNGVNEDVVYLSDPEIRLIDEDVSLLSYKRVLSTEFPTGQEVSKHLILDKPTYIPCYRYYRTHQPSSVHPSSIISGTSSPVMFKETAFSTKGYLVDNDGADNQINSNEIEMRDETERGTLIEELVEGGLVVEGDGRAVEDMEVTTVEFEDDIDHVDEQLLNAAASCNDVIPKQWPGHHQPMSVNSIAISNTTRQLLLKRNQNSKLFVQHNSKGCMDVNKGNTDIRTLSTTQNYNGHVTESMARSLVSCLNDYSSEVQSAVSTSMILEVKKTMEDTASRKSSIHARETIATSSYRSTSSSPESAVASPAVPTTLCVGESVCSKSIKEQDTASVTVSAKDTEQTPPHTDEVVGDMNSHQTPQTSTNPTIEGQQGNKQLTVPFKCVELQFGEPVSECSQCSESDTLCSQTTHVSDTVTNDEQTATPSNIHAFLPRLTQTEELFSGETVLRDNESTTCQSASVPTTQTMTSSPNIEVNVGPVQSNANQIWSQKLITDNYTIPSDIASLISRYWFKLKFHKQ